VTERAAVVAIEATMQKPTMKAIVQDRYGSAGMLQLREIDKPGVCLKNGVTRLRMVS
jgi:hypothetical protein